MTSQFFKGAALTAIISFALFTNIETYAHSAHGGGNAGGTSGSGGIHTHSPQTLPEGSLSIGLSQEFVKFDEFTDADLLNRASRHIHAHSMEYLLSSSISVAYGLLDDVMLSASIPYIYNKDIRAGHHSHGPGGDQVELHGDSQGIGDANFMVNYRFYNDPVHKTQASLILGLKVPTGDVHEKDGDELLDIHHQPGSGSCDPTIGFALGKTFGKIRLESSITYTSPTQGTQDAKSGDRAALSIAASYPVSSKLNVVLEAQGKYHKEMEVDHVKQDETQGHMIIVSPGVTYSLTDKVSTFASIGVPVVDHQGLAHTETDYKLSVGVGFSF